MKISSIVKHSRTRITSLVALLILAVLGSSWAVLRADVPRVASGTWAAAGEVVIPSGAVSVALADGRVVVAGGKSDGVPSPVISTYDPASGAWARVGDLVTARSGHAMTVLNDGRVLIAGGTGSDGPTFDIEIYDPANGTSVHAGDMTLARVDHAAATLKDGRVLIVGGSDGVSALNLAEIFDPATGQGVGVPNVMSAARVRATATAMIDGHVLVVGGNDGANDLASAEIFEPATGSFFGTGAMQVARSGHVAVLLPNNNQVLIAGGMSAGAAVASAELYADWRDGFSSTTPMSAARLGAIAGGLQAHDVAFVAGGGANTGDYYGYATVKTDKDDYWPGEPVTVTGSGWQPGETVVLTISEDADTHYDFVYDAVADEAGNITNSEFAPIQNEIFQHFGKRFYVTARGAASRALNTFTDGNGTINGTIRDSVTNAAIAGATVTCSNVGANPCNGTEPKTTTSAANGTYTLTFQFQGNSNTVNISVSAPGYATQMQSLLFNNNTRTIDWTLVPSITTTTLTVSAASGTYGGNTLTPLTATLTAGGNPVSGKTISFTLNGASVGSATTNSSGVATLASVSSLTGINAGDYPAGVAASFTADAAYSEQTASNTLTVNPAAATVTANAKSKTYGDDNPALDAVVVGAVNDDTLDYSLATTAVKFSGVGSYPIEVTLGTNPNYTVTKVDAALTVNPAVATVTANAKSKTYGDDNPALDAVVAGAVNGDALDYSLATTAVKFSGVGSYPIEVTLGTNPNYTVTKVDAALTVNPALATVTANAKSKTYGDDNPALDAVVAGAVNGDTLDYSLATTAVKFSAVGSYPITVTLGTNPNYTVTKVDAALTVDAREAKVEANAKSKTYGDDNPTLDATVTGTVNGDTLDYSLATTAVKFSGVGSYPIAVTLGTNPNYTVTKVDAALTVNPALATVTANAKSKTYGDDNPALDAVVVGAVNGDTLAYSLATTALKFSGVGSYPIEVTLGTNPNYTVTKVDAALTVNPALATVTANAKSKTYGDDNPALDAVVVGAVNGDTLAYSLATTALKFSGVGSYPIEVTLGPNPNYAITVVNGNLTIGKRTLTVTPDGGKTKILGEVFTAFTGTVFGLQGTDAGTATYASLGAPAAALVGSYDITSTFAFTSGVQSNYDVQLNTAVKGLVVLYRWDGFLQPINDTAHDLVVMSKFKAGQTIPAKFVLKNAAGAVVQQAGIPTFTRTDRLGACDSAAALENPELVSADVVPQYKWDGAQYHYNWSTKGLPAGLYRIFANLGDGTARSVDICLTK